MNLGDLERRIKSLDSEALESWRDEFIGLADLYADGWFDLLGSGWVRIFHGRRCRGLETYRFPPGPSVSFDPKGRWLDSRINRANLKAARALWQLVDEGYTPIDWQLDFKSGYRWSERTWYEDIPLDLYLGRDMKVPWELARCHHAVVFAWAFALTQDERYVRAFRNQLLDFMANNPPKFGVNWRSTMDVAIRVTNWVLAYDLFRAAGAEFDTGFKNALVGAVYDHGAHIFSNLESQPDTRNNHYMANISGLVFAASYLPCGAEINTWLGFAASELVKEISTQFGDDGAHYEGSTAYHRLVGEMGVYAVAALLGLSPERRKMLRCDGRVASARYSEPQSNTPIGRTLSQAAGMAELFPDDFSGRLGRIADFTARLTKPDGRMPLIGDDDSGRFFRAHPQVSLIDVGEAKARFANLAGYEDRSDDEEYWVEDHLEHRHLPVAIDALFDQKSSARVSGETFLDALVIRGLAGEGRLARSTGGSAQPGTMHGRLGDAEWWERGARELSGLPAGRRHIRRIAAPGNDLRVGLETYAWPVFGVYLFRSARLYLAVRCGRADGRGTGGHAHNDQLSISLVLDGVDLVTDPGSYLYTPIPERRDAYRSVRAHSGPQIEKPEPGGFESGPFRLDDTMRGECLYFGPEGFEGRHWGFGFEMRRRIIIAADALEISDFVPAHEPIHSEAIRWCEPVPPPLSPGYGIQICR